MLVTYFVSINFYHDIVPHIFSVLAGKRDELAICLDAKNTTLIRYIIANN